jgi:hypothetical protein
VVWPAIIEFIMMKNVWIYHTWFSYEDNFSSVSEALNLGAGQYVKCMHESKHFNSAYLLYSKGQWLPPVHQEARQVTDGPYALNATDAREY